MLLQFSKGYYELLQINQFSTSYSLTIYRGCSFEEYLVIATTTLHFDRSILKKNEICHYLEFFEPTRG